MYYQPDGIGIGLFRLGIALFISMFSHFIVFLIRSCAVPVEISNMATPTAAPATIKNIFSVFDIDV